MANKELWSNQFIEAHSAHLWDFDRAWLVDAGMEFVSRSSAKSIFGRLQQYVDYPARRDTSLPTGDILNGIVAPLPENFSLLLPGSVHDHEDIPFEVGTLEDFMVAELSDILGSHFLLTAIPGPFFCLKIEKLDYHVFEHMYSGNMTTPFALLSEHNDICILWDFDFQYTIVTATNANTLIGTPFEDFTVWDDFFLKKYKTVIPSGQLHAHILDKYVTGSLRGRRFPNLD